MINWLSKLEFQDESKRRKRAPGIASQQLHRVACGVVGVDHGQLARWIALNREVGHERKVVGPQVLKVEVPRNAIVFARGYLVDAEVDLAKAWKALAIHIPIVKNTPLQEVPVSLDGRSSLVEGRERSSA